MNKQTFSIQEPAEFENMLSEPEINSIPINSHSKYVVQKKEKKRGQKTAPPVQGRDVIKQQSDVFKRDGLMFEASESKNNQSNGIASPMQVLPNSTFESRIQAALNNSVVQSVQKVQANAKTLQAQRKLDDKKYNKVKSKVGRNMRVIEQTKQNVYSQRNTYNGVLQAHFENMIYRSKQVEEGVSTRNANLSYLNESSYSNIRNKYIANRKKSVEERNVVELDEDSITVEPRTVPQTVTNRQVMSQYRSQSALQPFQQSYMNNSQLNGSYMKQIVDFKKGYKSSYRSNSLKKGYKSPVRPTSSQPKPKHSLVKDSVQQQMQFAQKGAPYRLERPKTSYMDLTQTRVRKLDNPQYIQNISTKLDRPHQKKVLQRWEQKVVNILNDQQNENKYVSGKKVLAQDTPKFVNDTIGKETNVESASFYENSYLGSVTKPKQYISYFENPESNNKSSVTKERIHNFVPNKIRNFSPDENVNLNNVPTNSPAPYEYESFGYKPQYVPKLSQEELDSRTGQIREKQQEFLRQANDHDNEFEQILGELNRNRSVKNDGFYSNHVNTEYKLLEQGQEKTKDLIKVKEAALKTQIKRRTLGIIKEEGQIDMNVNMASKDPLKFIDRVLAHHN